MTFRSFSIDLGDGTQAVVYDDESAKWAGLHIQQMIAHARSLPQPTQRKTERMKLEDTHNAWLRDIVTGFTGTGIGYAVYATGCNQVALAPRIDKDGKRLDAEWFDIERIEMVEEETVSVSSSPSGGPSSRSETPPTR